MEGRPPLKATSRVKVAEMPRRRCVKGFTNATVRRRDTDARTNGPLPVEDGPTRIDHVEAALTHLDQVSGFGRSAAVLILILTANLAITALHSYQEWKGAGAPLWRNFGAIVGLHVPDWLGFLLFTAGLTLALWAVGFAGIAGWLPLLGSVSPGLTVGALGGLIGARLSDTLVSHVLLHGVGYRPNPGLGSTPLYVLEAIFIAFAFRPGLSAHVLSAGIGLIAGAAVFVVVLPLLRLVRAAVPAWRRAPWERWQPMPEWAWTGS
jgi:hypothetical protein